MGTASRCVWFSAWPEIRPKGWISQSNGGRRAAATDAMPLARKRGRAHPLDALDERREVVLPVRDEDNLPAAAVPEEVARYAPRAPNASADLQPFSEACLRHDGLHPA
ncbi:hypothetical protein GCM10009633_23500 [Janibacter melonis]